MDTAAKEVLATADQDVVTYDTLEFSHSLFSLKIVAGFESIVALGSVYEPYAFDVRESAISEGENNDFQAIISNVRRSIPILIISALESGEPISLHHRQVIMNSSGIVLSVIQPSMPYHVTGASESGDSVTISAAFVNLLDAVFLTQRYDATRFPGLA